MTNNDFSFDIKDFFELKTYKFYICFVAFYTICFNAFLMLEFWFHKPESDLKKRRVRRFVIWERRAFYHGFLFWLFRLLVFTYMLAYDGIFKCLGLYQNYKYLFVILAIVVFLDLFIGIRRVFKIKFYQVILVLLAFILMSFILVYFRPYDDEAMLAFNNRGINTDEVDLPVLGLKEKSYVQSINYIYFNKDKELKLANRDSPLSKKDFSRYLQDYYGLPKSLWSTCLFVDKNTSMKDFNEVKLEMIKADKLRVNIAFYSSFSECQAKAQYLTLGFPPYSFYSERDSSDHRPPPPPAYRYEDKFADSNIIDITFDNQKLFYQDSLFRINVLDSLVFSNYSNEKLFRLNYSGETTFQEYLELYLAIRNGIYKKRDELAFTETGFSYIELRDKEKYRLIYRKIREEVPFYLDEMQF